MPLLVPTDAKGVWPTLMLVSGFAALERGAESIELRDLLKAIYVADLEHVARFWDDWEHFERFVVGDRDVYLSRSQYLLQINLAQRNSADTATVGMEFGKPSLELEKVVSAARKLAGNLGMETFSSKELLYCICTIDVALSRALQDAGLNVSELERAIHRQQ